MAFIRKEVPVYTPEMLAFQVFSEGRKLEDVRSEYATLAKRARQRLADMERRGGGVQYEALRNYKNRFPFMKEIGSGGQIDKNLLFDALAEVTRFLNLKGSTIGGIHETETALQTTFQKHYGDELPEMDAALFGELMRSIKTSAQKEAYYEGWKKAYRGVLSRADKAGLSQKDLLKAVHGGQITIGPKGGLWDVQRQDYIRGKWSALGN